MLLIIYIDIFDIGTLIIPPWFIFEKTIMHYFQKAHCDKYFKNKDIKKYITEFCSAPLDTNDFLIRKSCKLFGNHFKNVLE